MPDSPATAETSAPSAAVAELYAARGLGGRLAPGSRPVVVVVDLINGFTDPGCPPGSDLDAVVGATRTLLDRARGAGVPVVFTTIAFAADGLEGSLWLRKMPAMTVLVEGSAWVEVDARLGRTAAEPVVVKRTASAFAGTGLAALLATLGADSLIVTGATTSGCVRATAVDACAAGYPAFVVADCVGDRARGPHEASLFDIDAKYGDVVTLDTALALLSPTGEPAP
ncbi:Maleamate amidohydrolase [Streptomyces sp. RB5]|uniref:Maleamate amidohydrolase n=1 Tax=Streptomyces smaragdinus TaxID=2585196 RepID=A0A7K0CMY8_9ACTN|nr:isochorismatase family protein [Streptomyces smaragdinus]MQY14144.1 Maleamate amidohydrolase [Streptomyces smaragdinus]